MNVKAYIGLGSNLGDRQAYLDRAIQAPQESPTLRSRRSPRITSTNPRVGLPGKGSI